MTRGCPGPHPSPVQRQPSLSPSRNQPHLDPHSPRGVRVPGWPEVLAAPALHPGPLGPGCVLSPADSGAPHQWGSLSLHESNIKPDKANANHHSFQMYTFDKTTNCKAVCSSGEGPALPSRPRGRLEAAPSCILQSPAPLGPALRWAPKSQGEQPVYGPGRPSVLGIQWGGEAVVPRGPVTGAAEPGLSSKGGRRRLCFQEGSWGALGWLLSEGRRPGGPGLTSPPRALPCHRGTFLGLPLHQVWCRKHKEVSGSDPSLQSQVVPTPPACGREPQGAGPSLTASPLLLSCGGGPTRQGPDEQTEARGRGICPWAQSQPERAGTAGPPPNRPLAGFSLPLRCLQRLLPFLCQHSS